MHSLLFTTAGLLASAFAAPSFTATTKYVVHEKREALPANWRRAVSLDGNSVIPLRIALTQSNLHQADEFLMDVSHPDSPNYGKHWTPQQVAETFAPALDTVKAVASWLSDAGIAGASQSPSKSWIHANVTVAQASKLLQTDFFVYEHDETGHAQVACEEYSIPEHLRQHVDFITPTVHFDVKLDRGKIKRGAPTNGVGKSIGQPGSGSLPKFEDTFSLSSIISELENCDKFITPDCLRVLYEFPPDFPANPKNSYGIVEYSPQAYLQSDLNLFFKNFSQPLVGTSPIVKSIDGGYAQSVYRGFDYNGESDLDLQYAMALVYPQQVTLYQTGDPIESASFNDFLDALDGSYCTGDDPSQDAVYPDPNPPVAGLVEYEGPKTCGGFAATKIISTSYGYNEADLTPQYEQRQCLEYLKLGLLGTTFLYSSGDNGVAGNGNQCLNTDGTYNDGKSGLFNPSFPSTCPYVTAVGATQIVPNATVTAPEEACETVIFSGGGFSNNFPIPSYQASAVKSYFTNHNPPYGADRYNNSRTTRAYPDVSANGANYLVAVNGSFHRVFGTSASSPTFGSVLTLVNSARLNIGKSAVGFINPVIYKYPAMFNDIVKGGNQGCGTPGFTAVPGWDPVTGLGTPNFPRMLGTWLLLP